ncbi:alpha/beta fold hydrolase [Nocardia sp. 348MFTsu5.1]|uniref:esterase/lipase family protein n=1 Tax=Nocardia sp. 348MFTsu5.1 TaxID=1172185 RepID=UPI000372CF6E
MKDATRARMTKFGMTTAALMAAATIGICGAGTASAATTEDLAAVIESGLKQPASDVILNGNSTWTAPVGNGPSSSSFLPAFAYGLLNPDVAPPGANDWSCIPKEGQEPVVLVHGTWENAYNNWALMSPSLKAAGLCVYALNYGKLPLPNGGGLGNVIPGANGTGDIGQSAGQLATFVDRVLASTGSAKVNIVGHSQGGLMARQYLTFNGGADKVDNLVTLGATNHGTSLLGIGALGRTINNLGIDVLGPVALGVGVSGIQQVYDSEFLKTLNRGGDTVPGVKYTVIGTRYDEITTPYASTFLTAGPGATVNNVTVQDGCEADTSDHLALSYSPRAVSITARAVGAETAGGVPVPVVCEPNAWLFG